MRTPEEIRAWHAEVEGRSFPETVSALLDAAVERFGEDEFLNYFEQGERLSFAGTREQVRRLAHSLTGIGVGRGTHVAVMLPNLPAYPVTWLALATLGAVMVPVNNRRYTARELRYVLEDSHAEFLVIHRDYFR